MIKVLNIVIKGFLSSLAYQEGKCIIRKDSQSNCYQDGNYNGAFYQTVTQLCIADSFCNIDMANQNVAITNYGKRNHPVEVHEEDVSECFDEADSFIIPDSSDDDGVHSAVQCNVSQAIKENHVVNQSFFFPDFDPQDDGEVDGDDHKSKDNHAD